MSRMKDDDEHGPETPGRNAGGARCTGQYFVLYRTSRSGRISAQGLSLVGAKERG